MKTLGMILMVLMLAGAAWAGDDDATWTDGAIQWVNGPDPVITSQEITDILAVCLEFIQDGSEDMTRSTLTTLGVYRPVTRDGQMRDALEDAQRRAERCERETALHKRIAEMIKKLKGE